MNTLVTRSVSGILIVALISGAILLGQMTALVLMLLIFILALIEFKKMFQINDKRLLGLLIILGSLSMVLFFLKLNGIIQNEAITGFAIIAMSLLILHSLIISKSSFRDIGLLTLATIWISGASIFFLSLGWRFDEGNYNATLPIVLMILIWINDAGAYLAGSLFGKRQLAPAISPGKTWEGFISGIIFSGLTGWGIALIFDLYSPLLMILTGIIISLSAVAGDLFESKLKREAGVKDSGKVIPGHGGMLDRFDSLFFSAPIFLGLLILWDLL